MRGKHLHKKLYLKSFLVLMTLVLGTMLLAACGDIAAVAGPNAGSVYEAAIATVASGGSKPTQTNTVPATSTVAPTSTVQPSQTASKPTYKPVIWFSASSFKLGDTLAIGGSGYPTNAKLNIVLDDATSRSDDSYTTTNSDAKGNFSAKVQLNKYPDGTPLQAGRIAVVVSADDADGNVAAGSSITLASNATATPTTGAITTPPATSTTAPTATTAAPTSGTSNRWIDVSLSKQKLTAYEGDKAVYSTLISSGVANHPTVTGTFKIYVKYVSQDMSGGTGREAYYLPNVPYVMYFYQDYGIHGAYWHHNFGHPMSHGCVNTPDDAAKYLFYWASIGTPVVIHN